MTEMGSSGAGVEGSSRRWSCWGLARQIRNYPWQHCYQGPSRLKLLGLQQNLKKEVIEIGYTQAYDKALTPT